jgi:hypothetical protein
VLGDPRLGHAGQAEQQQRAIGRKRGDGNFDQPTIADVLGADGEAVPELRPEQILGHRPW